jgi:hypothetical protein
MNYPIRWGTSLLVPALAVCAVTATGCTSNTTGKSKPVAPSMSASSSAVPPVQTPQASEPTDIPYPTTTDTPLPDEVSQSLAAKFGVPFTVGASEFGQAAVYTVTRLPNQHGITDGDGFELRPAPKHAAAYLAFHVSLTALDPSGVDYNPLYFYVRDADGAHYDYDIFTPEDTLLDSGTAHEGEKVSGDISFDAPMHGTLVLTDVMSSAIAEWDF